MIYGARRSLSSSLGHCRRRWYTTTSINPGDRPSSPTTSSHQQLVIVVRHGETDWNKELRVQGSTNVPLNAKGRAQAKATATALVDMLESSTIPDRINTSPLSRAYDTARAIADQCPTAQLVPQDSLREWNLGSLEGLTTAAEDFPDDWAIFSQWANPYTSLEIAHTPLSGPGESMEDVRTRVVDGINTLVLDRHQRDQMNVPIVCVTHGGVLGQLLRHVVQSQPNTSVSPPEYDKPGNACLSKFLLHVNHNKDHKTDDIQWTLDTWADTLHLEGALAPVSSDYHHTES